MTILIDTDPALGLTLRDIDDALAIGLLVGSGAQVAGLTTCFGNASLEATHGVARELGARWGLAVHRGAAHPDDTDTPAVSALLAHTGTVLALAPLTNVAAALRRGARWSRLVVLGGTDRRLPNARPLHTTELNFALDVDAAHAVLPAATDLVPMEVCRTVWMGRRDLAGLPAWMRARARSWLWSSPLRTGRLAFHPWDLLAAGWLTDPELYRSELRAVALASRPGYRGAIRYGRGAQLRVVTGVDGPALIRRLARIGHQL